MKILCLKEIKEIEFNILVHFREFCKEHNIAFYLSNGTLLGAVKYKGFIPWDDDIDVFVPREDYNRLLKIYCDTDQYQMFAPGRTKDYGYPFTKLCDMATYKKEEGFSANASGGLDIDIFPLDSWGDYRQAKHRMKIIELYRRLLFLSKTKKSRTVKHNDLKGVISVIVSSISKLFGSSFFVGRIESVAKRKFGNKSIFLGCVVWPIYGEREIISAEVFADKTEVEFEGETFPAPIGYDVYLRSLYGDYELDPPLKKRQTHHKFTAYKI